MINLELTFSIILALVIFYPLLSQFIQKNNQLKIMVVLASIFTGLFLRLYLAWASKGNYDMESFNIVSDLFLKGENVYAKTFRYNYTPIWFILLGLFKLITKSLALPFPFVVRGFLTFIDLASLCLLYKIARIKKTAYDKAAVLFFLNPISIILTGHHGQFENLTIFFILLGVYLYYKSKKIKLSWLIFTLAGMVKHSVFNQILVFLNHSLRNKKKIFFLFFTSIVIFLTSFAPFLKKAGRSIIYNVFLYRSTGTLDAYGVLNIMARLGVPLSLIKGYWYFFYPLFFVFPLFLSSKKLLKNLLLVFLFFLSFAPGFAMQYTILPIALGSLRGGPGFFVYTLITSFYLMGHGAELGLPRFHSFWHDEVWHGVMFWFFLEFYLKRKTRN